MAEALSQSQIDELLNKMRSGDIEAEPESTQNGQAKVKEYDFSSPKKFTKDQLKSLSTLYENFSRILSSYLTSLLRSVCSLTLAQIEEQRYQEFNNALPDNTLVAMISFLPDGPQHEETTLMFEFPTSFGYFIVDRLMGGSGEISAPERDYSEIEMALLQLVLENVTKYLQESWSTFFDLTTNLRSIETNGRLLQAYSPQDVVVIVTLEIEEEDYKGAASICMPAENLEEVIQSFTMKYERSVKQQDPEKEKAKKEVVMDYLKESDLKLETILDKCQMSLKDISQLQVDDIITLNKRIDDNVYVTVEDSPWYTARLGELNGKKAIKLVDSIAK